MGNLDTGLDKNERKKLLEKMINLREPKQKTDANPCKDSTTLTEETDDNEMKIGMDDKNKIINMIKNY